LAKGGEALPAVDARVWTQDWGVHLQGFGDGSNVIKCLGAYVCRTAIGDSRILAIDETHVTFRWKDRANGNASRTEKITGVEFTERYLRHVLPVGLRAIRRYGYCHPAAKAKRERVAFQTGRPLVIGPTERPTPPPPPLCPCCGGEMRPVLRIPAWWNPGCAPPHARAV
jgi:hypothetical protein